MAKTERANLSLNMDREDDRQVFKILEGKRNKTAFVVEAVLAFVNMEKKDDNVWGKELLKQAFREVLQEDGISVKEVENKALDIEQDIPEDIFELFDQM